jgi:twitching motility protein PilU
MVIYHRGNIEGELFFHQGEIVHAVAGKQVGESAVYRILSITDGEFDLEAGAMPPARTIQKNYNSLLLEGLRIVDETAENLNSLLKMLVARDGSDLYLNVGAYPMLSIGGQLVPVGDAPLSSSQTQSFAELLMNEEQRSNFAVKPEMNLAYAPEGIGRFRVNIYRHKGNVALVIRRIKLKIPTIEELNLPLILKDISLLSKGLVLVTGATGSGKSTTLAAMIDYRNRNRSGHIITIEDPLEYVHEHQKSIVSQRELGLDTDTYQDALENCLRQAPHVILVGEMRQLVTVEASLYYAETGHLVLSTLHATNADLSITRVVNFFPLDNHPQIYQQLANNLKAIIAQRLIPRTDGEGRVPAVEVMIVTARIRELIRKGEIKFLKSVIKEGAAEGMQTFDQSIYDLWQKGLITKEDALEYADSRNDLQLRMSGIRSIS